MKQENRQETTSLPSSQHELYHNQQWNIIDASKKGSSHLNDTGNFGKHTSGPSSPHHFDCPHTPVREVESSGSDNEDDSEYDQSSVERKNSLPFTRTSSNLITQRTSSILMPDGYEEVNDLEDLS